MPITKLTEKQIIGAADNMPKRDGRKFICIGPHCWGEGKSAKEAVANARKSRVKIYEGKRGWCFMLFDCAANVEVDGMGAFCYVPEEGVRPYIEIARFNMPVLS